MAYKEHPLFSTDGLQETSLWHYMTFAKFAELLRTRTLFFCSLSTLAKNDSQEGLYSKTDRAHYGRSFSEFSEAERSQHNIRNEQQWEAVRHNILRALDWAISERQQYAVSCWHARNHEDYAMWSIYAKESGMCIKTDFGRLVRALDRYPEETVHIGKVRYIDFESAMVGTFCSYLPSITKRREFSYESEVRAVINRTDLFTDGMGERCFNPLTDTMGTGISVPVNLEALIGAVFVSPYAEPFLVDTVTDLLRRHDLNASVVRSAI